MPDGIKFELVGLEQALRLLHAAEPNIKKFVATGLYREAEKVMRRSKEELVPVDTGNLRASGHVEQPNISADNIDVVLGFGGPAAPYALAVHENPNAGAPGYPHGSGKAVGSKVGQWKYLEQPLLEAAPQIRAVIVNALEEAFKKV